ncbi:MAG: hypothetical protein U1U88_001082 [Lawsonella clevelandensis]
MAGLAASFAVLGAPAAHAATVTKSVKLSCRTNGAPMKYNVTRPMNADIVITAPRQRQSRRKHRGPRAVRARVDPW